MIREVFSIKQLETLQQIMTTVINDCHWLKEFTAATEKIKEQIAEYEQIQRVLITYTVDRRIINEIKGKSERLQPGEETG